MSNELTTPIPPDVLDPVPYSLKTGDPTDDDGLAIDDTLLPNPGGPPDYSGLMPEKDVLDQATRILSRRIAIGQDPTSLALADPVPLFPRDLNRKSLIISLDNLASLNSPKTYKQIIQQNVSYVSVGGTTTTLPTVTVPVGSLVYGYLRANTINGGGSVSLALSESPGPTGGQRTIFTSGTIAVGGNSNTSIPTSSIPTFTDTITPSLIWAGTVTDATIDATLLIIPPAGYKFPSLVSIASEKSEVYNSTVYDIANGALIIPDHTGAVWIYSPTLAVVQVNAWSITK